MKIITKIILLSVTASSFLLAAENTQLEPFGDDINYKEALAIIKQMNAVDFEQKKQAIELKQLENQPKPIVVKKPESQIIRETEAANQLNDARKINGAYLAEIRGEMAKINTTYVLNNISVIKIGKPTIAVNENMINDGVKAINDAVIKKREFKKMAFELRQSLDLNSTKEITTVASMIKTKYTNLNSAVFTNYTSNQTQTQNQNKKYYKENTNVANDIKIKAIDSSTALLYYKK